MNFEFLVALRYIFALRKQSFIAVISLFAVCGVALGVAALIVVIGVMNGFTKDLRDKILRPVAVANFLADPLRAVRAARFAAVFPDFTVHADLLAAMRAVSPSALGAVAAERVGQETLKACASARPGASHRSSRCARSGCVR